MRFLATIAAVWLAAVTSAQTPSATTAPKKTAPKAVRAKPAAVKSTVAKSTATKSTVTKSTAGKAATSKAGASKTVTKVSGKAGVAKSKKQAVAPRRPPLQQQPTVERYKEIQQALADKGYFHGAADGTWGPESADALKRFQREQNLDADGKIGALSLMALGLGPKRGTASAQAVKVTDATGGAIAVDPPPVAQPEP